MAWITSNSVSVTNGSKTVTVTGNVDLSAVDEGWAVQIGSNPIVEASSGTAPDGSGNSTLTLMSDWPNATAASATMSIIPNSGYQITLADRIKAILARTVEVMQLQHDYASQLGQVTTTDPDTNQQHVYNTLRQNQQDMDDLLASLGTAAGYDVTSSPTDTNNGTNGAPKVLLMGAGGVLASDPPQLSQNALDTPFMRGGFFKFDLPITGSPGFDYGTIIQIPKSASEGAQLAFDVLSDTAKFRRWQDPVWHPWRELFHTGNRGTHSYTFTAAGDYVENTWYDTGYAATNGAAGTSAVGSGVYIATLYVDTHAAGISMYATTAVSEPFVLADVASNASAATLINVGAFLGHAPNAAGRGDDPTNGYDYFVQLSWQHMSGSQNPLLKWRIASPLTGMEFGVGGKQMTISIARIA